MKKGIWLAISAYSAWGVFPLYWKYLDSVPALQLLAHRIVWSFVFLCGWMVLTRQWKAFRDLSRNKRVWGIYTAAALLIGIHWLTFVWAVSAGRILEISLGYFITPLLSVFLGVAIFRERLRPFQVIPIGLAVIGVVYLTVRYGALPWIALMLAWSFSLYGLVKKVAQLPSMIGLTFETASFLLPACAFLFYANYTGHGAFLHHGVAIDLLLIGSGFLTTIPLLMFSSAAQSVRLTTIGLLQYLEPSIQFFLGLWIFREPFSLDRLIGFLFVWVAIILFALESAFSSSRTAVSVQRQL